MCAQAAGRLAAMIEAGQSLEAMAEVMRWALRDGFWSSRVLSATSWRDNYGQIRMQWAKTAATMQQRREATARKNGRP